MHVLCVEDDEGLLYLLHKSLEEANIVVTEALNGEQGLQLLQDGNYDAVVIDHEMPIVTGLEVIHRMKLTHNLTPIIMVTGAGSEEVAVEAMRLGASDYLVKDTNLTYLKILPSVIRQVIHERELAEAHQAVERALQLERERSKLLAQFIQDASHEFRTPLTLIQTACFLLERISEEPKQQTYIQRIHRHADSILKLVEHLLQLAILDNTPSLNLVSVELKSLLDIVTEQKNRQIVDKKLQLQLDLPENPFRVLAASDELSNALGELIDNACRYSSPDGVLHVALECANGVATITIRDTGIGMSDEQVSHIFERFYRVDEAHSTPGFGLGLPIVARIIELHHGEISVASEVGKGTSVTIRLPLAKD